MRFSKTTISEKWFFIFPLLFAIYPIIFLYSHNVQELLLSQLYVPVAVALCVTILCWACLSLSIKDTLKAGIIITFFIIFFYTYGALFDWLVSCNLFSIKNRHVLPVILVIAGYLAYLVYWINNREYFQNIAKIFTVIITVLFVINIINIIPIELKKTEIVNNRVNPIGSQTVSDFSSVNFSSDSPDIWYIILDEYASPSVINKTWGYDNSEFVESLQQKGFYIAGNSTTRYHNTLFSLYTSLNMQYPGGKISHEEFSNYTANDEVSKYTNISTLQFYQAINRNNVSKYLKTKGYKIVVMDCSLSDEISASGKMDSDITIEYSPGNQVYVYDDFQMLLIKNSMLKPLEYTDLMKVSGTYDSFNIQRNSNLFLFSQIKNVSRIQGPKFVFIHVMIPHTPFVFDRTGMSVDRVNGLNWRNKKYYLDQYIFTSNRISESIDTIMKYSDRPPLIILQSDHGPRPYSGNTAEENLDIPVDDMFQILNAYYLPNDEKQYLYDSITPVNTFRFIFNHTFHDDFPLLEDA